MQQGLAPGGVAQPQGGERKGDTFFATAPAVNLPKGGGAIRSIGEKFAANPVTGTGSLSVPITISPGRSGFGPQLSLSYDSGSGNGPFGFGWSLSLPSITRKTDKGLPQYRDWEESDVFVLSGAEDLVPVFKQDANGELEVDADDNLIVDEGERSGYGVRRYRPRIEGLFARIERWIDKASGEVHWRSISRDNITTAYGKTEESRVADPGDPSHIFSWLICDSYDDKGNAIVYEYAAENDEKIDQAQANERNRVRTANRYIKRVKYGNRVSRLIQPNLTQAEWMFEVVFDYEEGHHEELDLDPDRPEAEQYRYVRASAAPYPPWDAQQRSWPVRPDPFSSHRAGFEMRTNRRCHRVLMFHRFAELGNEPYLVRSTEFDYADLKYQQFTTIESELTHPGSTRFASFIQSITQSGYVQTKLNRNGLSVDAYLKKSLPPLEFDYSKAAIQDTIQELDTGSLENLPVGLDGTTYQWVDLDGEGISGILTEQGNAWYYKHNLSPAPQSQRHGNDHAKARFGPLELVPVKPSSSMVSGQTQFIDLAGDGQLDLATFTGSTPGFFERTHNEDWESFRAFRHLPNIPWNEPNLRFVDLTGDGHADVLITEQEVFTCHASLAEDGFGPAWQIRQGLDEERGPRLVLADGTQSIYLADMCGDGLTDMVRIRNGEVCYWPNLGYGRFGAKVTMDNAPRFGNPDQFSQQRVRLADIDGSGTSDIIYLGRDGVRLYFNQSGNGWSEARHLRQFPHVDNLSSVMTADLLGNGTACLVWSSPLPGDTRRSMRYIDLMGGQKPHLLIRSSNNFGAETHVQYTPSTKFYLADKLAGKPWITRIPFPVHVVERVETYDRISGNRFVTRYAYHHGYFDGVEREFRGFGMVEQWDTEEFAALNAGGEFPVGANVDESSHVPPALTRTWFHTGVYVGRDRVSNFFAGLLNERDRGEYYREPAWRDDDVEAARRLLKDTSLPVGLTIEEEREACRALKGSMLRQEVYALDGTGTADYPFGHPYTVTEQNFTIRQLQPKDQNRHAVFFTHAREAISYHYERNPTDPRVAHTLALEVDEYGNVLRSIAAGYPRGDVPERQPEQNETHLTLTLSRFANRGDQADWHRIGLPVETRTYEVVKPPTAPVRFAWKELHDLVEALVPLNEVEPPAAKTIPYEQWDWRKQWDPQTEPGGLANTRLRLIEHIRTLYRPDDLGAAQDDPLALLPLGKVESLALQGESYKLAFTPGLLAQVFRRNGQALLPNPATVLGGQAGNQGGYLRSQTMKADGRFPATDVDDHWWIPSGKSFFTTNPADPAATELAQARQHFFLPRRYRDPFGQYAFVDFDANDLLIRETRDALGNRMTVNVNDYRVLQPRLVSDPNRNQTEVAFDTLGMVIGTAVMGKPLPALAEGDTLSGFVSDLTQAQLDAVFDSADPHATAPGLLRDATTRIVYDLDRFLRTRQTNPNDPTQWQPVCSATLARETHASDPLPPHGLRIQLSFSYSDGFGREIQKKIQAEPRPLDVDDPQAPTVDPRWVGSGWTVFNNKGKPVRQYEPFFTNTHRFEFDIRIGVSPILFYDPVGRVVATLHPNHTYEKVVFDPWQQTTYDVNDTVALDPSGDDDVKGFFLKPDNTPRIPTTEYLPTWFAQRIANQMEAAERDAAEKAAAHANTPTIAHFDVLGRTCLTFAHNRYERQGAIVDENYATRIELDIEGNQRAVIDAKDRIVMRYDYDMLGNRIHQASMEAGERWMLNDVTGKPIRTWDSRQFLRRMTYDELRRPTGLYVEENGTERLAEETIYGEGQGEVKNHRTRAWKVRDGAGIVTNVEYDFKGNLQETRRDLLPDYKRAVDWKLNPNPNYASFRSITTYDALNRPVTVTMPDNSVYQPTYNEANLLDKVEVNLRGSGVLTTFVANINYNAKGQRELIEYGCGAIPNLQGCTTTYEYDEKTFRLIHLNTTRPAGLNGPASQIFADPTTVQDLYYTYEPVGNITRIEDAALKPIVYDGQSVDPAGNYKYDALYRLIEAGGREHIGQTACEFDPSNRRDYPFVGLADFIAHPNNIEKLRNYSEYYEYDEVGNFEVMRHIAKNGRWTRTYYYEEDSLIEAGNKSNRLTKTVVGNDCNHIETYTYADAQGNDVHGCMATINNMQMIWDFEDQLQQVDRGGGGTAYYVYDAAGQRVRKVIESQNGTRRSERIYVGSCEVYREFNGNGVDKVLERESLHVMDDKQRIALVETQTIDNGNPVNNPVPLQRYQLGNHLGSASVELAGDGQLISYEEYHPYGTTAFQAGRSAAEVSLKRYRYTGKERDEESGLNYYGARHFASWIGRWISTDPLTFTDSMSLYVYARSQPVRYSDSSGEASIDTTLKNAFDWIREKFSTQPLRSSEMPSQQTFSKWDDIGDGISKEIQDAFDRSVVSDTGVQMNTDRPTQLGTTGPMLRDELLKMKAEGMKYWFPRDKEETHLTPEIRAEFENRPLVQFVNIGGSMVKEQGTTNCSTAVLEAIFRVFGGVQVEKEIPTKFTGQDEYRKGKLVLTTAEGGAVNGKSLKEFHGFAKEFQSKEWLKALVNANFGFEVDKNKVETGEEELMLGDIIGTGRHRFIYLRTIDSKGGMPTEIEVIDANVTQESKQGGDAIDIRTRTLTAAQWKDLTIARMYDVSK